MKFRAVRLAFEGITIKRTVEENTKECIHHQTEASTSYCEVRQSSCYGIQHRMKLLPSISLRNQGNWSGLENNRPSAYFNSDFDLLW